MSRFKLSLNEQISSYYDRIPYDSLPLPQTAPEHLEALAFLFGLPAPAPATARVLELGCASGGNLIPFALRHPGARAVGIDLSGVQVLQGQARVAQLGLSNIELRQADLLALADDLGEFDYVICHGVFSWVPAVVQDAILARAKRHLAPDGIAYVSYNTYPGWKSREIVRDAMILRGESKQEPGERLAYARGMVEFLAEFSRPDSLLRRTLDENLPTVRHANQSYLLHEFLEPCNTPCYFQAFVQRAADHGLAYLADASQASMFVQNYGAAVVEPLLRECGGSQVQMEQYLDFLVNRSFRQTLLVHADRAPDIRLRLDADRIGGLHYAGTFGVPDGQPLSMDDTPQQVTAQPSQALVLRRAAHKAVAAELDAAWPGTLDVDTLLARVAARLGQPPGAPRAAVLAMLEELVILGAVRLRRTPVAGIAAPGRSAEDDRPFAPRALRETPGLSLTSGVEPTACNRWHEPVALSLLERCLLPLADGEHSRAALARVLELKAIAQQLRFFQNDEPVTELPKLQAFVAQQVELVLRDLRRKALVD